MFPGARESERTRTRTRRAHGNVKQVHAYTGLRAIRLHDKHHKLVPSRCVYFQSMRLDTPSWTVL